MSKFIIYTILSLYGIYGAESDCCDRRISDTITHVLAAETRIIGMAQFIRATNPVEITYCTEFVDNFSAASMGSITSSRIQHAVLSHVSNDHAAVARGVYKYLRFLTNAQDTNRHSKKRVECTRANLFGPLSPDRNTLDDLLDWLFQLGLCV
jgi:hypothetical protein